MDEIRIYGLECYAHHGVYEEEKKRGQEFVINATLYQNVSEAGKADELQRSTDYGEVCAFLEHWMENKAMNLLEAVTCKLAEEVLLKFPRVRGIDLEVQKPEAPIPYAFKTVSVKVSRKWHTVYLSIGSNMGDKEKYLKDAVEALKANKRIRGVKMSKLITTKPYGGVEQDDFLNGAVALETLLSPEELLETLHTLEHQAGRERTAHWGPRTLDLDILFYDKELYESRELVIPHIDMENRFFVLKPLSELCPNFRHPVSGLTVSQLLAKVESASDKD